MKRERGVTTSYGIITVRAMGASGCTVPPAAAYKSTQGVTQRVKLPKTKSSNMNWNHTVSLSLGTHQKM